MATTIAPSPVVDEIVRFNEDRIPELVALKYRRMRKNPFAFFRGTDHLFAAAWPELKPPDVGPEVWISGDLHLENFGAYRTDDGEFLFDVNDFDEAAVAPCSIDLVRCTASIVLAADLWGLSPIQSGRIVLAFLDRYRATVRKAVKTGRVRMISLTTGRGPIGDLLGATALGSRSRFLDLHTKLGKGGTRHILRGKKTHPDVEPDEAERVKEAVEARGRRLGQAEAYRVLDVTGRVAGIGSLGIPRYSVLVEGGGSPDRNWLLDVKQARPSSIAALASDPRREHPGEAARRVVEAQRRLQAKPTAGLAPLDVGGRPFRLRLLVPDENRSSLDRLREKPSRLRRAVEALGRIVAWSQVRGGRLDHEDRGEALARWADGPALDAVLASAIRFAERTRRDFKTFTKADGL